MPIRHRLLLSLAGAERPISGWALGTWFDMEPSEYRSCLAELLDGGLVRSTADGYVLAPGVVVSEDGFVGRVVRPVTMLGDGVPQGMWARTRKPLPSVLAGVVPLESGR